LTFICKVLMRIA